jgi:lipid-A-disaccharide synthase
VWTDRPGAGGRAARQPALEIQYIAPVFLQAVAVMHQRRPDLRFVLPLAPGLRSLVQPLVAACARRAAGAADGGSHTALAACDVTLIASGTATLEAALFKRPDGHRLPVHPISYQLMKRMAYQPWVGLPNILCRDFVVPELLQDDCTPAALADATLAWLDHPQRATQLALSASKTCTTCCASDTARRATDAIAQALQA